MYGRKEFIWSPNEKVAVEVDIGAALSCEKAVAIMKHIGVIEVIGKEASPCTNEFDH
jgi:TPP-dependent indolepyruvate ferredoxin oxidoreductase alpha subunit